MKKQKPAILPRDNGDPTGLDPLERKAMKDFARRLKKIGKAYTSALERIPASLSVNAKYTYQLDPMLLSMVLDDSSILVDSVLLEGGQSNLWFNDDYIEPASIRGTGQAYANLSQQSAVYVAARESLQTILLRAPYQRRMALVYARVFEEMKGFAAGVKRDMARVLTDGIGRGLNPRDVARNLRKQVGIETRRANTIARTEITTALRRARWDEADDARLSLGLKIMLLHFSALSPTTRQSHAIRHGHLYTTDEIREWYATGANAINCKCTQVEVLVDDKGMPLNSSIIEIAKNEFDSQWKKMAANSSTYQCCSHAA